MIPPPTGSTLSSLGAGPVKPCFRWVLPAAALCLAMLCLAGCGGSYGRLQQSNDISKAFENHEILPDHAYYATGPKPALPPFWPSTDHTPLNRGSGDPWT